MRSVALLALLPVVALAAEVDTDTGLIKRPGWEQVRSHCAGCHSFSLITNRRGDRQAWLDMIRWMQATQNLPDIPAAAEAEILDYLAQAYPPAVTAQRRAPIPANLMPR